LASMSHGYCVCQMAKLRSERQGHLVRLPAEAPVLQAEIVCPLSCKNNELWQLKAPVCDSSALPTAQSSSFFLFTSIGRTRRVPVRSEARSKWGPFEVDCVASCFVDCSFLEKRENLVKVLTPHCASSGPQQYTRTVPVPCLFGTSRLLAAFPENRSSTKCHTRHCTSSDPQKFTRHV